MHIHMYILIGCFEKDNSCLNLTKFDVEVENVERQNVEIQIVDLKMQIHSLTEPNLT
jgi:hypothetical protein